MEGQGLAWLNLEFSTWLLWIGWVRSMSSKRQLSRSCLSPALKCNVVRVDGEEVRCGSCQIGFGFYPYSLFPIHPSSCTSLKCLSRRDTHTPIRENRMRSDVNFLYLGVLLASLLLWGGGEWGIERLIFHVGFHFAVSFVLLWREGWQPAEVCLKLRLWQPLPCFLPTCAWIRCVVGRERENSSVIWKRRRRVGGELNFQLIFLHVIMESAGGWVWVPLFPGKVRERRK